MTSRNRLARIPFLATCLLAAALALPASAADAPAVREPSAADRTAIEDVLKKKVGDLLKEKNAEGLSWKRGTYSKSLRMLDSEASSSRHSVPRSTNS